MNSEQLIFKIDLSNKYKRKTSLTKTYQELIIDIRQTGGGEWWVEYKVKFTPNSDSTLNVSLIDKAGKKYENYKACFHQGIKNGLTEFIEQQNKRGISLGGMDIQVENFSYHPVDSKPIGYTYTLLELLNRLEKTRNFKKEIIEIENSSSFFKTTEISFDKLTDHYLLKETHIRVVAPRIFDKTIKLNKRVEIILNDLNKKRQTSKIVLSPKLYSEGRRYSIDLEFRVKNDSKKIREISSQIVLLNDQIKEVLEVLKTMEYNLSGLYISVTPLYDETDEPFIKSNKEFIKWVILNTLLNREYIEIKKEIRTNKT